MRKTCSRCGHRNIADAVYCENCGNKLTAVPGAAQVLRIGREPDNEVVLDFSMVSSYHARLIYGSETLIEDLGSSNGTFLNDPNNRITRARLSREDQLYFGTYRVSARRLMRNLGSGQNRDVATSLPWAEFLIGRGIDCGLTLNHPLISEHHVSITPDDTGHRIMDLRTSSGTFINGKLLSGSTLLKVGDQIMIGPILIIYRGNELLMKSSWQRFKLDIRNLSVVVNIDDPRLRKTLLDDISLVIYPGEFCGLMGLAGSGKSTLMKAANGYRRPDFGGVFINGLDFYGHYDQFRTSVGYVPQEDIFHKDLTVAQALYYAALLRLGPGLSKKEIDKLIDDLLERLAMLETNAQIRDTRIADISGGQKRRMNIAIELLTEPAIFYLDEPTSGLSSEDAVIVMKILRKMADEGKTILLTLHQPSMEIYEMMDNVIYLHKGGNMVYYGPTAPDSLTFTNPDLTPSQATANPELVQRALESRSPSFWKQAYKASTYFQEFVRKRQKDKVRAESTAQNRNENASIIKQWWILHRRNLKIKLQDRMNTLILLVQAPVIAVLISLVFSGDADKAYKTAASAIYLMVISAIWFGCSNAARDICGEWPVYQRERMFNLRIMPYVLAKFSVGAMICFIQCLVLVAVVSPSCHLRAPLLPLFSVLFFTSLTGITLGLFISGFASPFKKSNEIAVGLIPIVLLPMVILGGVIKPYKDMTSLTKGVASLVVTHWSFQAGLRYEADENEETVTFDTFQGKMEKSKKDLILENFVDEEYEPVPADCFFVIVSMCLGFMAATMGYLKYKDLV